MNSMMHPNQIPTSPQLVRDLMRSQFPALADERIDEQPFHGTDSDTYRVGTHHSVRLPIIDWAIGKQEHIRPWLRWIDERITRDVPIPVYYGAPDCGYPHDWTIYPWLPGATRSFGMNDRQAATDVAVFLRELRNLPVGSAPTAGRSPHALDADVRNCLAQLTQDDQRDVLIDIWDAMMQTHAWDGEGAVWMHGDIAPGNLLFADGRFSAAIDWTELGVGDPASDLQVAWNMFASDARQVFRDAMAVDDETWYRARARAFAQASFQLPYYRESLPALARQAQYVFSEILAEFGR